MVSPKNGSSRVAGTSRSPASVVRWTRLSCRPRPRACAIWPRRKLIFPSITSSFILLTDAGAALKASRRCTSVSERDDRLQVERPVERGVAAADDHHVLVAEILHLAHGIEHRLALVGLDAVDRRALGLERAAAGGDHHDLGEEHLVGIGRQPEAAVRQLLEARRPCG